MLKIVESSSSSFGYRIPKYDTFQRFVFQYWNVERIVVLQALMQRIEQQRDRLGSERDTIVSLAEDKIRCLAKARYSPFAVAAEIETFLCQHNLA